MVGENTVAKVFDDVGDFDDLVSNHVRESIVFDGLTWTRSP